MKMMLSFRVQDTFWIAYLTNADYPDDPLEIGRVRFAMIDGHPDVKDAFMAAMKLAMEAALKDVAGVVVGEWEDPVRAQ